MATSREVLGTLVRSHREQRSLTQEGMAEACKTSRSAVAHLEQGLRVPKVEVLRRICLYLAIPDKFWEPYTRPESLQRFEFEDALTELLGRPVSFDGHDQASAVAAEELMASLFSSTPSDEQ